MASTVKVVAVSFEKNLLEEFDKYLLENNLGYRSTFIQNVIRRIIFRKSYTKKNKKI